MKKTITFLAALCLPFSIWAQDAYYYYHGSKVTLKEDATRVVCITPKSGGASLSPSGGLTLVSTIQDSRSLIRVYRLAPSTTIKQVIAASPSASANSRATSLRTATSWPLTAISM